MRIVGDSVHRLRCTFSNTPPPFLLPYLTPPLQLRFVHNCFPHHGYIWNYGCVPQVCCKAAQV